MTPELQAGIMSFLNEPVTYGDIVLVIILTICFDTVLELRRKYRGERS